MNVGGKGMPMERLAMLAQIAQKQEAIMMTGRVVEPVGGHPRVSQYPGAYAGNCVN